VALGHTHWLPTQAVWGAPQRWSQPPQLLGSVLMSTQLCVDAQ
jgi:hypothetical protein